MDNENRESLLCFIRELEERKGAAIALAEAVRWSIKEEIVRLLDSGVDANARLDDERTPLMYAGTKMSAECLLKAGADPNAIDAVGRTSLIWFFHGQSTKQQAIAHVRLYLTYGADTTLADHLGKTAFDYAKTKCDDDVLQFLKS